ncbi:unnamed protein product [Phytophthora lilii]|uniref:Unnamed protein product n=1 Tax=Phytophthora lilii TaxID=2077276 RepID=A0A9W6XMH7_9STRA|nr:unnamed protein product [Phytophthora lilii]
MHSSICSRQQNTDSHLQLGLHNNSISANFSITKITSTTMKFFAAAAALLATCTLTGTTVSAETTGGAPWGYKTNDATMAGPAQWADHYPTCGGSRQSPIDIITTTGASQIELEAQSSTFGLVDTVDANYVYHPAVIVIRLLCGVCERRELQDSAVPPARSLGAHSGRQAAGRRSALCAQQRGRVGTDGGGRLPPGGERGQDGPVDDRGVLDGMEAVTPIVPTMMSL